MDFTNNPFLVGQIQGSMDEGQKLQEKQAADLEKERGNLIAQFDKDVSSVKDLMSKIKDPQQRAVVGRIVEQMKASYPEAGKKFGLDSSFSRQLDFATQNPYDMKGNEYNANSGSSPEIIQLQDMLSNPNISPEDAKSIKDRIYLKATGQSPPDAISAAATSRASGKDMGVDYAALSNLAADVPTQLESLNLVENAVKSLGDYRQGPIAGNIPLAAQPEEAQKLSGEAIKGALSYVAQTKGAISDKEMALFKTASIGTGNDMNINLDRIEAVRGALVRTSQQAAFFNEWKKTYGSLDGAYEAFKQYATDNPIFKKSKDGFLLQLSKPAEELANDNSWQQYLSYGMDNQYPNQPQSQGQLIDPSLPPIPPVNMDANGGMSGGMPAPASNNDPLGIR